MKCSLAAHPDLVSLPGDHETNAAISGTIGQTVVFDLPDDYYNAYVNRVQALTLGDMRKAATQLLHPEALTWVVVGDLGKIESSVRAFDYGDVQVLDADGKTLR